MLSFRCFKSYGLFNHKECLFRPVQFCSIGNVISYYQVIILVISIGISQILLKFCYDSLQLMKHLTNPLFFYNLNEYVLYKEPQAKKTFLEGDINSI